MLALLYNRVILKFDFKNAVVARRNVQFEQGDGVRSQAVRAAAVLTSS